MTEKISDRIKHALKNIGWKERGMIANLSRELNISQTAVRKWFINESIPSIIYLKKISDITNTSPEWIMFGSADNIKSDKYKIKVLSCVQAGNFTDISSISDYDEEISICKSLIKNPEKSFALTVNGNSMMNKNHPKNISNGEIVIVDTTLVPNFGDVVVAITKDNQATVKLLSGDDTYKILQPLNPSYDNITAMNIPFDECYICGVVIYAIPPLRPIR